MVVEGALILVAFGACLAFAPAYVGVLGFLKNWALGILVVVGLFAGGAILGRVMWNALCGGLWVWQ